MKPTETFVDPVGRETLDVIGKAGKFNRWMYSTIQSFCQGRILEIGSGTGNISGYFLNDGFRIFLSDLNDSYCDDLRHKFGSYPNLLGIEKIDLASSSFEDEYKHLLYSFNSIFALNVVEHISDDRLAIQNAGKLLKPGGRLIILVPSCPFLYCRFDRELDHFRRYTPKSLHRVISNNGYKKERLFHFNLAGIAGWFLFGKLSKRKQIGGNEMGLYNRLVPLFRLLDRISMHKLGLSIIVVASKPNT